MAPAHPEHAAHGCEQQALGEQLSHQPAARCAQRQTHRQLARYRDLGKGAASLFVSTRSNSNNSSFAECRPGLHCQRLDVCARPAWS